VIARRIFRLRPRSLLDVGCGSAAYGLLFRDLLERRRGRYHKKDWLGRIDAVEVWPDYITPVHEYVYDNIVIADIRQLVNSFNPPAELLDSYDMIFMGDVLEHFSCDDGADVLQKLQKMAHHVLISTPVDPEPQDAYNGNEHERHISKWTPDELQALGYRTISIGKFLITAITP
jgi:hypothetical protein